MSEQFVKFTYEEVKILPVLGADGIELVIFLRRNINRNPKHKWYLWSWPDDVDIRAGLKWSRDRLRAARKWLERCRAATLKRDRDGWHYLIPEHLDLVVDRSLTAPNPSADRPQNRRWKVSPSPTPLPSVKKGAEEESSPTPLPPVYTDATATPRILNRETEIDKPQEGGEDLPPFPKHLPHEVEDPLTVAWTEFHLALESKSPMGPTNAEAHRREYLKLWNALPPKYKLLQKSGSKEDT